MEQQGKRTSRSVIRFLNALLLLVVATVFLFMPQDPLLKAGLVVECLAQVGRSLIFEELVRSYLKVSVVAAFRWIALLHVGGGFLIAIGAGRIGGPVGVLAAIGAACWIVLWVSLLRMMSRSATAASASETTTRPSVR
jgi:hypothetical protein